MNSFEADPGAELKTVAVAMSGGVDSSVAAALLQDQGYDVLGIMMRLWSEAPAGDRNTTNRCCTPDQMADARLVADVLGIPFYVVDVQDFFHEKVVDYYLESHANGLTPNPCIRCNRDIRFGFLLDQAVAIGADFLATGHYARIRRLNNNFQLVKAVDIEKDQSYALYMLGQSHLTKILFPVGDYLKRDVRRMAADYGLPVADKSESMDLCFISDGDQRRFLMENLTGVPESGPIRTASGDVLGEHIGLAYYTIGQRKGLGIAAGRPMYVLGKESQENALVVGPREQLGRDHMMARETKWVSGRHPQKGDQVEIKIRYRTDPKAAIVCECTGDEVSVQFDEPVYGVTAGQGAVFYRNDICLGGGIIADEDSI